MKTNLSVTIFRHELANQRQYNSVRREIYEWADRHQIPKVANVTMEAMLANPSALAVCEPPFVREMMGTQVIVHLLNPDRDLSAAVARLCGALDKKSVPYHRSGNDILDKEEILALDWVWIMGTCPETERYGEDGVGAPAFTECEAGASRCCPACGGIVEEVTQASNLRVHPEYLDADGGLPWDFANASNGALVISRRAHDWMRARKLTGFETRPVRRQGGERLEGVVQLQGAPCEVRLSPTRHALHPTSCLVCRRDTSDGDPIGYLDQDPQPQSHFMTFGTALFVRGTVARELSQSNLTGFFPEVGLRVLKSAASSTDTPLLL